MGEDWTRRTTEIRRRMLTSSRERATRSRPAREREREKATEVPSSNDRTSGARRAIVVPKREPLLSLFSPLDREFQFSLLSRRFSIREEKISLHVARVQIRKPNESISFGRQHGRYRVRPEYTSRANSFFARNYSRKARAEFVSAGRVVDLSRNRMNNSYRSTYSILESAYLSLIPIGEVCGEGDYLIVFRSVEKKKT